MGAWEDYQLAAQRLDAVRREAATLVAERTAVAKAARKEIAAARQRIAAQRARLLDLANRWGVPAPGTAPDTGDQAAAQAAYAGAAQSQGGNPAAAATILVRGARASFDQVDQELSTLDDPRSRVGSPLLRNVLVYAVVALVACLVPVLLVEFGPSDPAVGHATMVMIGAYCSAAILPLFGYAAAWLIAGLVGGRRPGQRRERSAAIGALVTVACVILVYGAAIVLSG